MPDDYTEEGAAAYFALMEAGELLKHHVEQQLRRDGALSYVQFRILAQLMEHGGSLRMTDLADGVVYSRAGLTYQASILEKEGLVARHPSPEDERSTMVQLTIRGRERLETVVPGHVALVAHEMFGQLSEADIAAMADVLTRLRDHLRAVPPRSVASRRKARPS